MADDTISIIITILNGERWLEHCMQSICQQKQIGADFQLEICVFDDCSTDATARLLRKWQQHLKTTWQINMHIISNDGDKSRGVGYGRNKAIAAASGQYFCFQDIDDEMLPERIAKQYHVASQYQNAIVGSKFERVPANSTCRYTKWANDLNANKLNIQIYTSFGPTVIMPTWMCHRSVYDNVPGGFVQDGYGTPEDLLFFYEHLDRQGIVLRVDECLLRYRYHPEATTFSINSKTIWRIRLQHLIENILLHEPWCSGFTIWNAGKQGRKLFRDLPIKLKNVVNAFCDVDKNKIHKFYQYYDVENRLVTHQVPIIHFREAKTPVLICMKLQLTNGVFEENLKSLNLNEGKDYILFT